LQKRPGASPGFLFKIQYLILTADQSSKALPVKIASCFGVLEFMKSQTPSTKLQTNLKFQSQMTKTGFEF
jgi:hypothetical protein